jgi:hypothetical protein
VKFSADGTHKFGLLNVKIGFRIAGSDVSGKHKQGGSALCRFPDPCDSVCEARAGMNADQGQFPAHSGVGVSHRCSIAFVPGSDEFHPCFGQGVCDFEVGSAENSKAPPRTEVRQEVSDSRRYDRGLTHKPLLTGTTSPRHKQRTVSHMRLADELNW